MSRLLLLALLAAPAAAAPPPELAHVPADAVGIAHVRLADLWKNPAMAGYRSMLEKAGADALGELDRQFQPRPSTLDRVTTFVTLGQGGPQFVALLRFSKPFDPKQIAATSLADARKVTAGDKTFYVTGSDPLALHFLDEQTIAVSDEPTMKQFAARKPVAGAGSFDALLTADTPVVMAVRPQALPIPPDARKQVPEDFQPLLAAELATVTVKLEPQAAVAFKLVYPSEKAATAAEGAVRKGLDMLKPFIAQQRQQGEAMLKGKAAGDGKRPLAELPEAFGGLMALAGAAEMEALLANPPLKRDGTALAAEIATPTGVMGTTAVTAVAVGLLLPAVQKVREAAARSQSQNNLKQIALALHNYESAHQSFPPAAITDKKTGKRLLSWRVSILPYIEQDALYKKFKLDEPWDSPNNLPLSKIVIKTYTDPRATDAPGSGLTYYKAFVSKPGKNGKSVPGQRAAFDWNAGRKFLDITDGTSNTLLVGAFGPPVVWTQPDDFEFDPKAELPDLFAPFTGLNAAFADGSVRFISPAVDPKQLKAMITADGGEIVNFP